MLLYNVIFSYGFSLYGTWGLLYNKWVHLTSYLKPTIKLLFLIGFSVVFFFIPSNSLYADEPSNLDSILKEVLNNNREIKEAHERLQAAKYRLPQASALPDPTAGTAYMGKMLETPLGPQENLYEFEQMIPFPGKLIEQHHIAASEVNVAEAKLKETERNVILKTSETYHDLFAIDVTIQTIEGVKELLKKMESVADNRYASQSSSQRDVAKAQAEVSDTLQRLLVLHQQRNTLEALLNNLLNHPANSSIGPLGKVPIPSLTLTLDELLDLVKKNRPELQEASAMLNREEHASKLSKYNFAPDFSVGFQYIDIGKGTTTMVDDGRDAWMIPIKVTLPIWQNRIGPSVMEAKRNLNASRAGLEQTQNTAGYEVRDAYYRFTSSKQIVELYENALLPETQLAFNSDQAGYEAGRVDILNFIDSERVYLNTKVAYYQAQANALKNFAALERAVGMNFPQGGTK